MRKVLLIVASLFVVLAITPSVVTAYFRPSATARREWKDQALAGIEARLADPAWATNEIARLAKTGAPGDDSDSWLSAHLIRMRNGEWLAYANICQKENRRIEDLFLARGSNGQWYYSTYHFCKSMIVLRMDEQPNDLPSFLTNYYLRPFDGHSDECLQRTWPPRPANGTAASP